MTDTETLVPVRFDVLAEASPGLLPRLLQPLARRDLVPDHLRARPDGDLIRVVILLEGMPAAMVALVAGNLGQVVGVMDVAVGVVETQIAA